MKKRQKRQARVLKAIAEASLTGLGDIVTKRGEMFTIAFLNGTKFGVHTMLCGLFNQKNELLYILRDDDLGITPEDITDDVDAIVRIIWGKKPYTVLF